MLKFGLSIEEANLILVSLSKAPYEQVAGLITKLREQAQPQVAAAEAAAQAPAPAAE